MKRRTALAALALFAAACASKPEMKRYPLRGEVMRLYPAERRATIKHEEIKGWMGAMTMDFPVPDEKEFAKLREGARIRGTVYAADLSYHLAEITVE